ncbi:hypothetical protein [Variovorax ginsengisoli]|uniref:Lipoprotein n=1 Tax=Variovorax ginsengisoli TaxID=363844 RepID=A0ABT8S9Q3_9BURK|nr:hypothetical protein [Variovorax ginsengisoli]MDN8616479.1 hypothetical protein [Variovorax ginsengisoli]MDO1535649.1 hypothetical protein [Variovorax ginsengisoli]
MSPRFTFTTLGLLGALLLSAGGCSTAADTPPPSGWFGNVFLGAKGDAADLSKVFIVTFRFGPAGVSAGDVAVSYGTASRLPNARRDYVLELVDADGRTLDSQAVPDPLAIVVEKQGNARLSEGLLTMRFAFSMTGQKVRLSDASGRLLAEAQVESAIVDFCKRNTRDSDCIAKMRR